MKVIIVRCKQLSYWYRCRIGETFEVIDRGAMGYLVLDIDYIQKEFIRITPHSKTELLPIEGYNFYERFDYVSHYGSYNCSYLIKPVYIDPKHYLDI